MSPKIEDKQNYFSKVDQQIIDEKSIFKAKPPIPTQSTAVEILNLSEDELTNNLSPEIKNDRYPNHSNNSKKF